MTASWENVLLQAKLEKSLLCVSIESGGEGGEEVEAVHGRREDHHSAQNGPPTRGRNDDLTARVINTQSVKTMEAGGECGYDAGLKRIAAAA